MTRVLRFPYWHAYRLIGGDKEASFEFVGCAKTASAAARRAGAGGFIEPAILSEKHCWERGFPKSYQRFIKKGFNPTRCDRFLRTEYAQWRRESGTRAAQRYAGGRG